MSDEGRALQALDTQLTSKLRSLQHEVLARVAALQGEPCSIPSLHGIIGGKNTTFVDSIRTQFSNPDDFFAQWLDGLLAQRSTSAAAERLIQLLKDNQVREYTEAFLTRNFYRNRLARTRAKPTETLWSLWFGQNPLVWGLIIAPALRRGQWTNDVSEVRRTKYKYWTIGHVLTTGLIDPTLSKPIRFANVSDLMIFYASVLSRVSNSLYEKEAARRYAAYLDRSTDPSEEPFLIPELRYAGVAAQHKYRLDFSILNPHVMEFIGFELSPASTHMAISHAKTRKQKNINAELAENWAQEMTKRNSYFSQFGITTITFTDDDLRDLDNCFRRMEQHLSRRAPQRFSLEDQLTRLRRA